jgi:hypothetical protein
MVCWVYEQGHITCQRRINTVEKLVTEFKFSTHAVKMALERCGKNPTLCLNPPEDDGDGCSQASFSFEN